MKVRLLSISELTKRVGIAQGSFYNFWKDKDSLVIDLMACRSIQKLENIEKNFQIHSQILKNFFQR